VQSSTAGSAALHRGAVSPRSMPWSFPPWFLPLWVGAVGWQWWRLCARELTLAHPAGGAALAWAASAGTLGRLAAVLVEAGFYVLLWAGFGRRLRFWRFASWLIAISMLEVLAESTRLDLRARGGAGVFDALLLGPGVLHAAAPASGLTAALGGLGVATAFRIGWTALIQARALGVRWAWAAAAVGATWLMTRGALWMVAELMRGRSVAP
jgi:hypothetical protein